MTAIIQLSDISKTFHARRGFRDLRGKGGLGDWLRGRKEETFTALQNISLEVEPGESLGIIGRNGSGKSTLLSIIAGVTLPSTGTVRVFGRVASLLELGAGFNPILTGRENIYLNAGLLGMRHAQVDAVYDDIVRFSGIGEFIDQPVETYSSGMYVRIGFAVAAFVNPDIFLADEVLAVGDAEFQRKCRSKIGELREQGKTIIFVSHDLGIVNTLCERVVLLENGRMIQRETAQKTITYYLRQVGMEKGLHAFTDGDMEAIHCDGRISLFQRQNEISAPSGFRMQFVSLGQEYYSGDGEWEVLERSATGCKVAGRLMRLPIRLIWELAFDSGVLRWRIGMECERECPINMIFVLCMLPTEYVQWIYGDLSGAFPPIAPSDVSWNILAAPEAKAANAAALPETTSPLAPILFSLSALNSAFSLYWANTDYVSHSRMLCAHARFPEHDCIFTPGFHPLVELTVDTTTPREAIVSRVCSDRIITSGKLSARFEQGRLRLAWDGREITEYLHVYTSMLIEYLWNDSHSLQWGGISRIPNGIRIVGESRRFPFRQEWEISAIQEGIRFQVWLETDEDLDVQEYHATIVLPALYGRWETDHEQQLFPEFDPVHDNWIHCNRDYRPGKYISALSKTLPCIKMVADDACPEIRMTSLNTSKAEHARALQALRVSDAGRLRFPKGRHPYFSGSIQVSSSMPETEVLQP